MNPGSGEQVWLCVCSLHLILGEHFVPFLPSHVMDSPQSGQITVAALILTVVPVEYRKRDVLCPKLSRKWPTKSQQTQFDG